MWHLKPVSTPPPFMANAILNFHFDFPHPSLIWCALQKLNCRIFPHVVRYFPPWRIFIQKMQRNREVHFPPYIFTLQKFHPIFSEHNIWRASIINTKTVAEPYIDPAKIASNTQRKIFRTYYLKGFLRTKDGAGGRGACCFFSIDFTDMEFVQNFTPSDFQAKTFTPSISPNFYSFSKKKHKK